MNLARGLVEGEGKLVLSTLHTLTTPLRALKCSCCRSWLRVYRHQRIFGCPVRQVRQVPVRLHHLLEVSRTQDVDIVGDDFVRAERDDAVGEHVRGDLELSRVLV